MRSRVALVLAMGAVPAPGTVFQDCPTCPQMVMLPTPPGAVPLAMSRYAVGFDDWAPCVAAGGCRGGQDDHGWGRGSRPIINITWDDATDYVRWLAAAGNGDYALPGSAEWEYAARGGSYSVFWWGDRVGHGHANCRDCGSPWPGTAPAGAFPANPFGLYEITGNVWTWTADCAEATAPNDTCRRRLIRGGAWYYQAEMARSAVWMTGDARQGSYTIGVRVVRHFSERSMR